MNAHGKRLPLAITFAMLVALGATTAEAAQSASGCAAAKEKAAGKCIAQQLKCYAVAAKNGTPVSPDCLSKASLDLELGYDRIESKGGCATTDDSPAVLMQIDESVALITSGQNCSDKLKAVAKEAMARMKCYATADKKDTSVDPACLSGAEAALIDTYAKLETAGKCSATGEDAATAASHVSALVSALADPCDVSYDGHCWFLGASGASCTETCTANGKAYDSATHSLDQGGCGAVLDVLGVAAGPVYASNSYPIGCSVQGGVRVIEVSESAEGAGEDTQRACACQ